MRILVLGGAGFIGAHLGRRLLDAGHCVISFDISEQTFPNGAHSTSCEMAHRIRWLAGSNRILGDVADRNSLRNVVERFDPDCICYLAAMPVVKLVNANPEIATASMTVGLTNCLEIIRESKRARRFVYVSSSMVYGHFVADPMPEEASTIPVNLYGGLKLAGEVLVRAYLAGTQHEAVVVRPSGVYGPTDIHGRVVQKCCEAAIFGQPFIVTNPDTTFIDFTWVVDLAAGLTLALTAPEAAGETFNLTFGAARSLRELVDVVRSRSGGLNVVVTTKDFIDQPRRGTLDISKARRLLGFMPCANLEHGVEQYIQFIERSRRNSASVPSLALS